MNELAKQVVTYIVELIGPHIGIISGGSAMILLVYMYWEWDAHYGKNSMNAWMNTYRKASPEQRVKLLELARKTLKSLREK